MAREATFSVRAEKDYIHLVTWGDLDVATVTEPTDAALTLAKEKNIDKLLDNIQEVDFSTASIPVQAKGMGVLWKLRAFRKVAVVYSGDEPGFLFFSSIRELRLNPGKKFQGFDNEKDAITWLQES